MLYIHLINIVRRCRGFCVGVGMNVANYEIVALLCLKGELKRSSEYPCCLRKSVENTMNKFKSTSDGMVKFRNIVSEAHLSMNWKSIAAKCGYKQLKSY